MTSKTNDTLNRYTAKVVCKGTPVKGESVDVEYEYTCNATGLSFETVYKAKQLAKLLTANLVLLSDDSLRIELNIYKNLPTDKDPLGIFTALGDADKKESPCVYSNVYTNSGWEDFDDVNLKYPVDTTVGPVNV